MATAKTLAAAHIRAEKAIRDAAANAVAGIWKDLPGHDRENVDEWLSRVLPVITASQRRSAGVTDAFLAQAVGRRPLGVPPGDVVGAAARNGASPEDVYTRPFVTLWTALKVGDDFPDAMNAGLARATSTAATDVQLAMRETLRVVGGEDDHILGYSREPDGEACDFCVLVSGQRYTTDQLMPIHNHCGCGVTPITAANRGSFTGRPEGDLSVTRDGLTAEVRDHGELGPVLVNAAHDFTQL